MRVIARQGAMTTPLLDTKDATTVELRDDEGNVIYALFILKSPEGTSSFITSNINESDFPGFLRAFGIEPKSK